VFHESAARDNAGNNVDILLNVHDVFHESAARDKKVWKAKCIES
jgi:hypothetical protein